MLLEVSACKSAPSKRRMNGHDGHTLLECDASEGSEWEWELVKWKESIFLG